MADETKDSMFEQGNDKFPGPDEFTLLFLKFVSVKFV